MRVVIGADHAGFGLKEIVVAHLIAGRTTVNDVGTDSTDPVEYPPICAAVAELVVVGEADWGIVIGGSGQGEQIAANKVVGARAALCGLSPDHRKGRPVLPLPCWRQSVRPDLIRR